MPYQQAPTESWHVAYTMPRTEKKVADALEKAGVASFFPVHYVLRKWSDRMKKLELPLFPNYIFVRVSAQRRFEVTNIKEVIKYVSFDGKPAIVSQPIVEALKKLSGSNMEVIEEKFSRPGMEVRICEGPFAGVKGWLVKKNGKSKLLIRVESLKSTVSLEIDSASVMPVDEIESIDEIASFDEIASN